MFPESVNHESVEGMGVDVKVIGKLMGLYVAIVKL